MRILIIASIALLISAMAPGTGELVVEIDNIKKDEGIIWIGVYDSEESFLIKEKAIILGEEVQMKGSVAVKVSNLAAGEYAIALFHDVNKNGDLDRNLVGIPTEPFAFSGQPKSRLRLPRFDEVKFNFNGSRQKVSTRLHRWYEKNR